MQAAQTKQTQPVEVSDLYTIEGLVAQNPEALSISMLRWQLRHRQETGLAACCVRGGKNILISKSRYESWLASQAGI